MTRAAALVLAWTAASMLSACAPGAPARPAGAPVDDPAAVQAHVAATGHCRPLRTVTAEIRLTGRAGTERVRARLITGFAAPESMRLEALAPFGAPALLLVSDGTRTTLFFPRDQQVLSDAPVADVLGAIAGLALDAGDLRAVLMGCLGTASEGRGVSFGSSWGAVDADGARVYLRNGQVVAADYRGWLVDYSQHLNGIARAVRVRRPLPGGDVDLQAALAQVEINVDVPSEAFTLDVPASARAITLEDLRAASPFAPREP